MILNTRYIFILSYLFLLFGYYIGEDLNGNASEDYIGQYPIILEFNYNSIIGRNLSNIIYLDKKDEGTVVLFPSLLQHIVYPFHNTTKTRISIAGNIVLKA